MVYKKKKKVAGNAYQAGLMSWSKVELIGAEILSFQNSSLLQDMFESRPARNPLRIVILYLCLKCLLIIKRVFRAKIPFPRLGLGASSGL